VVYNGSSDQVTSLRDPVGKTITFGYDGNGKLSTFTDPAGRQTRVTINASTNQLTYDSLPSPTAKPYTTTFVYQTYPGTNTVVLTKRIGVLTDTTIVTYDSTFKRRPSQVRLPGVQDENGSAVNPVITYFACER
jgi:YD repeat-containing protein